VIVDPMIAKHMAIRSGFQSTINNQKSTIAPLARIAMVSTALALVLLVNASTCAAQAGGTAMSLTISSPSFSNGGNIDKKFTCDGADVSPQLQWNAPPAGTGTFSLLVDDPDAPVGNWNHWTLWNVPASSRGLPEAVSKQEHLADGTEQGKNDFHKTGYNGPCPPPSKPHRYYFKLYALDTKLDLKSSASKKELEAAMKGHILAQSEWVGQYGR
jgi:Raf kinase inhibitor-like YbhB/YbcL family protein